MVGKLNEREFSIVDMYRYALFVSRVRISIKSILISIQKPESEPYLFGSRGLNPNHAYSDPEV